MVNNNACNLHNQVVRPLGKAEQLLSAFRTNGMKVTPQRRLLCKLIGESHDHPTVENLYHRAAKQMPTISLKTVYTTLTDLSGLGSIKLSSIGSGSLRVDPDPTPHAHLVCKTCDHVIDKPLSAITADRSLRINHPGFTVEDHEFVFRGHCARCNPFPERSRENRKNESQDKRQDRRTTRLKTVVKEEDEVIGNS